MSAVQCREVHADDLGRVIRTDYHGRTYYHAAGRCIEWDDSVYHVAVTDYPHFPTLDAARQAIREWVPTWPTHARDHARARKVAARGH